MTTTLDPYDEFTYDDGHWSRPVYRRGGGPAVIVVHEIPGIHPLVIRFADYLVDAGMTVYLPSLFGTPVRELSTGYLARTAFKAICISREFSALALNRSSPIVNWLRALAREAHAECGGRGVGAVGMCFTGGFSLAMMTEPAVVAPVASQPSLPLNLSLFSREKRKHAVDLSNAEAAMIRKRLEDEDLSAIALRFCGDSLVPAERFETLRRLFGDRLVTIEIPDEAAAPSEMSPHSVLTTHLDTSDESGETWQALQRVISFLKQSTA